MKQYDVIIIGAGPSGIFCAYELIRQKPDMKVLMIEKGRSIEKRQCPKRKTKVCVGCQPCSITTGFAGAGAFSDGKLSLSPDVGGTLPEILGYEKATELINEADNIYLKFGADEKVYGIEDTACLLYTSRNRRTSKYDWKNRLFLYIMNDISVSVSYTHLDVYKRQVYG